jgi:hypothetical protein
LLRGRIFVPITRNNFHPEPHRLDCDFSAKLTRAEQKNLDGGGFEGRS